MLVYFYGLINTIPYVFLKNIQNEEIFKHLFFILIKVSGKNPDNTFCAVK